MANLNVVVLDGRLVEDPKLFAASDGSDVTLLRLEVTRPKPAGSSKAEVDVIDVVVRNGDAKTVARWLGKNCRAGIKGRLYTRTWDAPEGPQSRLHVLADRHGVEFIDFRDRGEQTPTPARTPPASPAASTPSDPAATAPEPTAPEPTAPPAEASPVTDGSPTADAPQTISEVIVWADGGSRGNPGPAGYGVLITTVDGNVLAELAEGIGATTNNVAEYRGVIAGLQHAKTLGARQVQVRADAKLIIQQLKGANRVKSAALAPLHTQALQLAGEFESVSFEHVTREANQQADALANRAMNTQGTVPDPTTAAPTEAEPSEASAAMPDDASAARS